MLNFMKKFQPEIHGIVLTDADGSFCYKENGLLKNIRDHELFKEKAITQLDRSIFWSWYNELKYRFGERYLVVCSRSVIRDAPKLKEEPFLIVTDQCSGDFFRNGYKEREINNRFLVSECSQVAAKLQLDGVIVLGGRSVYEQFAEKYTTFTTVTTEFSVCDIDPTTETKMLDIDYLVTGMSGGYSDRLMLDNCTIQTFCEIKGE